MKDSVLTPLQEAVLREFFRRGAAERGYYLTGGTALAEFYLRHRCSDDLDLFTSNGGALSHGWNILEELAGGRSFALSLSRRDVAFLEGVLEAVDMEGSPLVVHLAEDPTPSIEPPADHGGVIVDSLVNIAVQKVETLFWRTEPKDFVDLYFILHEGGFTFDALLSLLPRKHQGLSPEMFVSHLGEAQTLTFLPRMIKPLTLADLQDYFMSLARALANRYRPPDRRG